jgi:hypothetical protein
MAHVSNWSQVEFHRTTIVPRQTLAARDGQIFMIYGSKRLVSSQINAYKSPFTYKKKDRNTL